MKFLSAIFIIFSLSAKADGLQTKIIQDIQNFYSSQGINIAFEINEKSELVSASADTDGTHHKVTIDRGLLKSPRLSEDGLRTIICHEIGHILGGDPRKSIPMEWDGPVAPDGNSYMSSEGQADHYASSVCFRQIIKKQNHSRYLKNIPTRVLQLCNQTWGSQNESSKICQRSALGAENFLKLTFEFPISFDTPSTEVAESTIKDSYPSRQCRLDTLLAGALLQARPACWYVGK